MKNRDTLQLKAGKTEKNPKRKKERNAEPMPCIVPNNLTSAMKFEYEGIKFEKGVVGFSLSSFGRYHQRPPS